MVGLEAFMMPNRDKFASDPFGYSALTLQRWAIIQEMAGFPPSASNALNADDLKSPVLWLTHARALSDAALVVLKATPDFADLPTSTKGICDGQYCAVGLMLVGYSLEVCLKGMLIVAKGVDGYRLEEKKHFNHQLVRLSEFIPNLSKKDKAILLVLTHFVVWAGRYPDPGSGKESNVEEIFSLSEAHRISARDLFDLAGRVMGHVSTVVNGL